MASKKNITIAEAYDRVASRCVQREYCRADWYRKLMEAGLCCSEVEKVLDQLEDENFINEERYARSFVHDKFLYDRWGRIKITYALRQKAISNDNIKNALTQIKEEEYLQNLKEILRLKAKSVKAENDYELRQKLARFAASRGFEPGLIFKTLDLEDDIHEDWKEDFE